MVIKKPAVSKAQPKPKAKIPPKKKQAAVFQTDTEVTTTAPRGTGAKLCGQPVARVNSRTGKKRKEGQLCTQPAGFGTEHPGFGKCRYHGGNTKQNIVHAAREQVKDRIQTYGGPVNIGPHEALIFEVQRTAGHVQWLGEQIAAKETSELVQMTLKDGMDISAWIKMYQEERKMLVQVCRVAIGAGVAERKVRIAEEQGKQLATAMLSFINHPALNLTPQQQLDARPIIGDILRSMSSAERVTMSVTSDIEIEGVEDE